MVIEWESDLVRLVDLQGYRRASHWPHNARRTAAFRDQPHRQIQAIAIHHSMGGFYSGLEAVERLAAFFLAPPEYKTGPDGAVVLDRRGRPVAVGGGKGWPGIGYTFVVPAIPEVQNGRLVVYRIWPDSMRTWHTGGLYNTHGVGICVGGHYASAADPVASHGARARPDDAALTALGGLVDYLAGRYRLELRAGVLVAHREVATTLCPGDFLADWIRAKRGEEVAAPRGAEDRRALDTALAVQAALAELGYRPGELDGVWGPRTQRALKLFQAAAGVAVDGIMGPKTEQALRVALAGATRA